MRSIAKWNSLVVFKHDFPSIISLSFIAVTCFPLESRQTKQIHREVFLQRVSLASVHTACLWLHICVRRAVCLFEEGVLHPALAPPEPDNGWLSSGTNQYWGHHCNTIDGIGGMSFHRAKGNGMDSLESRGENWILQESTVQRQRIFGEFLWRLRFQSIYSRRVITSRMGLMPSTIACSHHSRHVRGAESKFQLNYYIHGKHLTASSGKNNLILIGKICFICATSDNSAIRTSTFRISTALSRSHHSIWTNLVILRH